ncbi:hypothetical protein ACWC8S_06010, partial [Streptomyces fungicidicus]
MTTTTSPIPENIPEPGGPADDAPPDGAAARPVRLIHTADVLTCLGNSLAYVHNNQDIQAVFRT